MINAVSLRKTLESGARPATGSIFMLYVAKSLRDGRTAGLESAGTRSRSQCSSTFNEVAYVILGSSLDRLGVEKDQYELALETMQSLDRGHYGQKLDHVDLHLFGNHLDMITGDASDESSERPRSSPPLNPPRSSGLELGAELACEQD